MNLLKLSIPDSVKAQLPEVINTFQINTPLRLAHFLAQTHHESGGFKFTKENMNYSAQGLLKIFKKYFTAEQANAYAKKPQAIANRVYANRMGNGNEASGDGYKYKGSGFIQLTGKSNYEEFDKFVKDDIINNPDLVATKYPLLSAGFFWNKNNINKLADVDNNVSKITKVINGGQIGLAERTALFNKYKRELGI